MQKKHVDIVEQLSIENFSDNKFYYIFKVFDNSLELILEILNRYNIQRHALIILFTWSADCSQENLATLTEPFLIKSRLNSLESII